MGSYQTQADSSVAGEKTRLNQKVGPMTGLSEFGECSCLRLEMLYLDIVEDLWAVDVRSSFSREEFDFLYPKRDQLGSKEGASLLLNMRWD